MGANARQRGAAVDWLVLIADDIASADLTVTFDEPLEPHAARLMNTLGVTVSDPGPRVPAVNVIPAHELAETRNCRKPLCTNMANPKSPRRGRYASLCDDCHQEERKRASSAPTQREEAAESGIVLPAPPSLVPIARELVSAAQLLERKQLQHDRARLNARRSISETNAERKLALGEFNKTITALHTAAKQLLEGPA